MSQQTHTHTSVGRFSWVVSERIQTSGYRDGEPQAGKAQTVCNKWFGKWSIFLIERVCEWKKRKRKQMRNRCQKFRDLTRAAWGLLWFTGSLRLCADGEHGARIYRRVSETTTAWFEIWFPSGEGVVLRRTSAGPSLPTRTQGHTHCWHTRKPLGSW